MRLLTAGSLVRVQLGEPKRVLLRALFYFGSMSIVGVKVKIKKCMRAATDRWLLVCYNGVSEKKYVKYGF